ncbi:hypothetical protein HK22_06110 [Gluconobacter sp. DsW_056]|nr:hypothetical protein HK22_06110 [Gluconobacter sp. DsW_056]
MTHFLLGSDHPSAKIYRYFSAQRIGAIYSERYYPVAVLYCHQRRPSVRQLEGSDFEEQLRVSEGQYVLPDVRLRLVAQGTLLRSRLLETVSELSVRMREALLLLQTGI